MTNTIKITFRACLAILLGLSLVVPQAYANHSWGKYHWDLSTADTQANPLTLGDNLTNEWSTNLVTASADWNLSVLKNEIVPGASNQNCDPTLGRVEVCNAEYGPNGWLGIAQVWTYRRGGHIAQAIVQLNDTYFSTPTYNTTPWRNLVMCQEVGHTFGLGHQDENFSNANLGTCMDYTSDPTGLAGSNGNLNNEHPNQHDYDQLASIYAHLNETSGGGAGKGGKGKPSTTPNNTSLGTSSEWGQAIAQDAQGRDSVFVRNENGFEVITHVLWTMEYEGHDEHSD